MLALGLRKISEKKGKNDRQSLREETGDDRRQVAGLGVDQQVRARHE